MDCVLLPPVVCSCSSATHKHLSSAARVHPSNPAGLIEQESKEFQLTSSVRGATMRTNSYLHCQQTQAVQKVVGCPGHFPHHLGVRLNIPLKGKEGEDLEGNGGMERHLHYHTLLRVNEKMRVTMSVCVWECKCVCL